MTSSEIIPFKESNDHSYRRTTFVYNYFLPFIYHVILKKRKDCGNFGKLTGDAKIKYDREISIKMNDPVKLICRSS